MPTRLTCPSLLRACLPGRRRSRADGSGSPPEAGQSLAALTTSGHAPGHDAIVSEQPAARSNEMLPAVPGNRRIAVQEDRPRPRSADLTSSWTAQAETSAAAGAALQPQRRASLGATRSSADLPLRQPSPLLSFPAIEVSAPHPDSRSAESAEAGEKEMPAAAQPAAAGQKSRRPSVSFAETGEGPGENGRGPMRRRNGSSGANTPGFSGRLTQESLALLPDTPEEPFPPVERPTDLVGLGVLGLERALLAGFRQGSHHSRRLTGQSVTFEAGASDQQSRTPAEFRSRHGSGANTPGFLGGRSTRASLDIRPSTPALSAASTRLSVRDRRSPRRSSTSASASGSFISRASRRALQLHTLGPGPLLNEPVFAPGFPEEFKRWVRIIVVALANRFPARYLNAIRFELSQDREEHGRTVTDPATGISAVRLNPEAVPGKWSGLSKEAHRASTAFHEIVVHAMVDQQALEEGRPFTSADDDHIAMFTPSDLERNVYFQSLIDVFIELGSRSAPSARTPRTEQEDLESMEQSTELLSQPVELAQLSQPAAAPPDLSRSVEWPRLPTVAQSLASLHSLPAISFAKLFVMHGAEDVANTRDDIAVKLEGMLQFEAAQSIRNTADSILDDLYEDMDIEPFDSEEDMGASQAVSMTDSGFLPPQGEMGSANEPAPQSLARHSPASSIHRQA